MKLKVVLEPSDEGGFMFLASLVVSAKESLEKRR